METEKDEGGEAGSGRVQPTSVRGQARRIPSDTIALQQRAGPRATALQGACCVLRVVYEYCGARVSGLCPALGFGRISPGLNLGVLPCHGPGQSGGCCNATLIASERCQWNGGTRVTSAVPTGADRVFRCRTQPGCLRKMESPGRTSSCRASSSFTATLPLVLRCVVLCRVKSSLAHATRATGRDGCLWLEKLPVWEGSGRRTNSLDYQLLRGPPALTGRAAGDGWTWRC